MFKRSLFISMCALLCTFNSEIHAQVRITPVAGLLFRNHMPSRTIHSGNFEFGSADIRRDGAALLGIQAEYVLNGRLSLVGAYATANADETISVFSNENDPVRAASAHVNLMSAQARLLLTGSDTRMNVSVSAGPARVATGNSAFDLGGNWAAAAGVAVGYHINESMSVMASQDVFAYRRLQGSEFEHTLRLGLTIQP